MCAAHSGIVSCLGCVSHVINRKINKRASHIISEEARLSLLLSYSLQRKWTITAAGETTGAKGAYNFIMSKLPVDVYV